MATYTFSTSSGFASLENLALIEADIASQITDNTRTDSEIIGDTIALTFESPLSDASVTIIHQIFSQRDTVVTRGDKIISIYPMTNVKTTTYQIISRFPCKNWNITNIEVFGNMDSSMTAYSVKIYDPTNNKTLVETELSNTSKIVSDLGTITNIPSNDSQLEVHVKTIGNSLAKNVYIESIIVYYM